MGRSSAYPQRSPTCGWTSTPSFSVPSPFLLSPDQGSLYLRRPPQGCLGSTSVLRQVLIPPPWGRIYRIPETLRVPKVKPPRNSLPALSSRDGKNVVFLKFPYWLIFPYPYFRIVQKRFRRAGGGVDKRNQSATLVGVNPTSHLNLNQTNTDQHHQTTLPEVLDWRSQKPGSNLRCTDFAYSLHIRVFCDFSIQAYPAK